MSGCAKHVEASGFSWGHAPQGIFLKQNTKVEFGDISVTKNLGWTFKLKLWAFLLNLWNSVKEGILLPTALHCQFTCRNKYMQLIQNYAYL